MSEPPAMGRPDPIALDERIAVLERRVAEDPADEAAWFALGRTLLERGRAQDAVRALERAVEVRPDYTAAWRDLGRARAAADDPEAARTAFERGIEASRRTGDVQTRREIEVFARRLDPRGAPATPAGSEPGPAPEAAPEADPRARALSREAFRHFVRGALDEAIDVYHRALEIDPHLAIAWNGLAMALAGRGDLDQAIEAARRLVEIDPDDPLGHTSLSIFYQRKGWILEAEEERALALQLQLRNAGD